MKKIHLKSYHKNNPWSITLPLILTIIIGLLTINQHYPSLLNHSICYYLIYRSLHPRIHLVLLSLQSRSLFECSHVFLFFGIEIVTTLKLVMKWVHITTDYHCFLFVLWIFLQMFQQNINILFLTDIWFLPGG